MTTNFLFLPVAVLLFTFPLLKPRTLKHPNQIYANKRNSCMVYKSHISFRSYWSLLLSTMIELFFRFRQLCLYITDSLHLFTQFLTDSLEKCQTKSFENEYSTFCNFQILYHKSTLQKLKLQTHYYVTKGFSKIRRS